MSLDNSPTPGLRVFNCPSCGASLSIEGTDIQVRCQFCGNTVIVPEELRVKPVAPPPPVYTPPVYTPPVYAPPPVYSPPTPTSRRRGRRLQVILIIIIVVAGLQTFYSIKRRVTDTSQQIYSQLSTQLPDFIQSTVLAALTPEPPSGFAKLVMQFGGSGTGAGKFDDARGIALDDKGSIYVAEYSTGRVQKFDAQGKFVTDWNAASDSPVRGLAADRAGHVFVVQGGNVFKYDGKSGELISKFKGSDYFDDVAVLPNGELIAASYINRDDIVHLDQNGQVVSRIKKAISGQTGKSELDTHVAVDGSGNIFALGTFSSAIFQFSPAGKFLNKFGSDGDEPGQFRAPYALAVDSQSRVYVSDFKGIQVFDANGRYLDVIEVPNHAVPFGLAINAQDEIFAVAGNEVFQFTPTNP
jgi:DNA-binding beta-propeller fold protein YncE